MVPPVVFIQALNSCLILRVPSYSECRRFQTEECGYLVVSCVSPQKEF